MIPRDWMLVAKGWAEANAPRRTGPGALAPSAEVHRQLLARYD